MYLTVQGLVIRVSNYNETDALLTVLTQHNGKIAVKARGLRRKNSPLIASCQLLSYAEFTLFEYRGMYTINEAHSIQLFQQLRRDLSSLSLGTYFAQVADVISQEDMPNPELLQLVLNCLHMLCSGSREEDLIKSVFELRIACLAGYTPDLSGCHRCMNLSPDRFDVSQGHLECHSCRTSSSDGIRMPVSAGVLDAMRYICSCDSHRLFSFQIGADSRRELSGIAESYLSIQLERGFSTLDFYKSLQNSGPAV